MRNILISLLTISLVGACSLIVDFEPQDQKKETNCTDGIDSDGDGATDCEDPDCWTAANCVGEVCDNGLDDDGDSYWDCEDPECWDDPNCGNVGEVCDNGLDDDGDAMADCDDPECYAHPHCTITGEDCMNGEDDDGDGQVDCDDSDCTDSPGCLNQELCRNGQDDDDDGLIDCEDQDCWGVEGCNNPGGEHDCGNAWDDDMDDLVDCMDPDCDDSILCQQGLAPCVTHIPFSTNFGVVFYYRDIYQSGVTTDCGNGQYCGIRPEVSMIPHCYPQVASGLATAYQPCAGMTCGPGLVCLPPGPDASQEVCLPLCAPGYNNQCIGGEGVCYMYWMTNYDNHIDKDVELWTCGRPQCDPMNLGNNGCNPTTAGCYPSTDLFGEATCVYPAGAIPTGGPCPGGDHECAPGNVCRTDADVGESVCRLLCTNSEHCTPIPGAQCHRDDSRQLFGYCR